MLYKNANYAAFYVKEPFSESALGAYATHDFCYYSLLQAWNARDPSFNFIDAHETTYNVRDDSEWDTLKQRLHERLNNSKNIILFLSSCTKNDSLALNEEMEYGILKKKLPVIVVYPDFKDLCDIYDWFTSSTQEVLNLWNRLPAFRDNMDQVPTLHIPYKQELIKRAINDIKFDLIAAMSTPGKYSYQDFDHSDTLFKLIERNSFEL